MTVVAVLSTLKEIMRLIDQYNRNNEEKVEVNWQYWLTNTVYCETSREGAYGQSWTVYRAVSRDGLVLEVFANDNGMFIRIGSVHKAICEYE